MPPARDAAPLAARERRRTLLRVGLRAIVVGCLLPLASDAPIIALVSGAAVVLAFYAAALVVGGRAPRLQDACLLLGDVPALLLIVHFTPPAYAAEAVVPAWLIGIGYTHLRRGAPVLVPFLSLLAWGAVASHAPAADAPLAYLAVQTLAMAMATAVTLALTLERSDSRRDALTGVLTRRSGLDELEMMLAQHDAWVAFVDLRGFKAINDRHGHHVGDEVLAAVGRRLDGTVRGRDVILRYGGDEFLAASDAPGLEPRLRAAFTEPVATSAGPLAVDGRVGVIRARVGTDLQEIVVEADRRMYHDEGRSSARSTLRPPRPRDDGS